MSETNFQPVQEQPVVYPVLTENIKDLDDVKKLLKAIGLAMSEEYANENGMAHLIEVPAESPFPEINLP